MQSLQDKSGSGVVTIPKDYLERDDVLKPTGELPDEQNLSVERLGRRVYVVRLPERGTLPDLENCEFVERLAAHRLMNQNALGQARAD